QSVHVFKCDAGSFSIQRDSSATLEAAASNGDRGTTVCCNRRRKKRADSQGNRSELNNCYGRILWCAIRRSDGEEPLAVFIRSKEVAVQPIDIGHELLRKINAQTQSARMGIENINAAFDARTSGSTG